MRWTPGGVSDDIEDRRDDGGGGGPGFGGFGFGGMHLGIGGTVVLLILGFVFRHSLFNGSPSGPQPVRSSTSRTAGGQKEVQFVSFVIDDVQHTWDKLLPEQGKVPYHHAKLVLFRDYTQSGCGTAQSATGPFYCPADEKVYIDLGFYDELRSRFGVPGEFAQAYVLAHEIGHHVQKLLGVEQKVHAAQEQNPSTANHLSVELELQADCFAGVWGHSTEQRKLLDPGEVRGGLDAAAAVGDDRLQRMATGHVNPETFTHGSSQQRMDWFQKGFATGDMNACNTFTQ